MPDRLEKIERVRVLMLSRDASGLDSNSATAERWRLLRDAGVELDIVVISVVATARTEPGITVTGTGGSNVFVRLRSMYRLALAQAPLADVITAQDPMELGLIAFCVARQVRKKYEVQDHGGFFDGQPADEPLWFLRSCLARWVARRANQIRTVSPKSLERLRESGLNNAAYLLPVAAQMRFLSVERDPDPELCITVSRLIPVKRVDLLLRAFVIVRRTRPAARLVVVGDGPSRDSLVVLAARLGLSSCVEFVGAGDPAPWLARASVFALLSAHEGWGVAAVEAALAGVSVVMSDTGCARWLEARGRATVVGSRSPQDIAQALLASFGTTGMPGLFEGAIGQKETANAQVASWRQLQADQVRILVCTQAVDADDPLFGFFISWLAEAAAQYDRLTVLALRVGRYELPANVRVLPLRPRVSRSRALVIWNLLRYSWRERFGYESVYVRGDAQYVVLAGWLWHVLGKRIVFWYAHYSARSWWVAVASRLASINVTSVRAAGYGPHALPIGQAIETRQFPEIHQHEHAQATALVFGRVSPVKRIPWILEELARVAPECARHVMIVGRPTNAEEGAKLRQHVDQLGAHWEDRDVLSEDAPALYQTVDVYLNATPGSLDKTIVEAMLTGLVVVASTPGFGEMLPPDLRWLNPTDADFGTAAARAMNLSQSERQLIASTLRVIAMELHGQSGQIGRLRRIFLTGHL